MWDFAITVVYFHIYIFASETTEQNKTKFGWDGPMVVPFQNCASPSI